jgi:Alr-MurF fusion protein
MIYIAREIADILGSDPALLSVPDARIEFLATDTRKIEWPEKNIFFALTGSLHDGHDFVHDALDLGIKNIVIHRDIGLAGRQVNVFMVDDTLVAMQKLAAVHRQKHSELLVIGITGSNGKTTVKEWLYQMITDRQVVKSPKSYNSQTGVALPVWQIRQVDNLGIFEAGVSQIGEMTALEKMIKPDIGIFTMIGDAHAEGFASLEEKLKEKLILFQNADSIIYDEDDVMVSMAIRNSYPDKKMYSWGWSQQSTLFRITDMQKKSSQTELTISYRDQQNKIIVPFTDTAAIENSLHCLAAMLVLNISFDVINMGFKKLHNIPMRLEMKNGIHNSILINDTYNADIQSFRIALDFLDEQAGKREKVLIISDFMQTGLPIEELNHQLASIIQRHNIGHVIGVGSNLSKIEIFLDPYTLFHHFENTGELLLKLHELDFDKKAILVKGARVFKLEKVIKALSEKAHTATLETDLQSVGHNLRIFSQYLQSDTKIIAVIKASAYGSGSEELAKYLEYRKVAYLAVAYIDEGIQLRKAGIILPIIILNPDRNGVPDMIRHNLEPEVYCIDQLQEIVLLTTGNEAKSFRIHLKMDTGMHRLGFQESDMNLLCQILRQHTELDVKSIFSHLSSSEDPTDDNFSKSQVVLLENFYSIICNALGYKPWKHILNSAGIIRFPEYHFDMVRLGLGLYGIDSTDTVGDRLEKVHTLKATVIQVKQVKANDYVGYNRRGVVTNDGYIGVVNIGYADGLLRMAGNGKYSVSIRDTEYSILGNVCMDLTIIDLGSDTDVKVGDEVIIFGKSKPVEQLSAVCGTIPYEILSRISSRVRRLYIQ